MGKTTMKYIVLALVLILAQVVVFNHICLFNVALPVVFIYLIYRLPMTLSVNWVLTISFFLGLIVDAFSDTPGLYSLSCTVIAMMRRGVLRLYTIREEDFACPEPSMKTLGAATYIKYMLTLTLVFFIIVFLIDGAPFYNFELIGMRIIFSTLFTSILLIGIDSITNKKSEKRL